MTCLGEAADLEASVAEPLPPSSKLDEPESLSSSLRPSFLWRRAPGEAEREDELLRLAFFITTSG